MQKISWQLGQNIYPEHFDIFESKILQLPISILKKINFNIIGFIEFEINSELLQSKVIKFEKLAFITADGVYININNNAQVSSFEMSRALGDLDNHKTIYIGINFRTNKILDDYIEKYDDTIKYEVYNLEIEASNDKSFDLYLAELKNNEINFNSTFPFVNIFKKDYTEYLYKDIELLVAKLKELNFLEAEIFEYYFNTKPLASSIFDRLCELYIQISVKYNLNYDKQKFQYNHFDQRTSFSNIINAIFEAIKSHHKKNHEEFFNYKNGMFYIKNLDLDNILTKKVFLKFNDCLLPENIKVSSIERIDYINMHSLEGIKVLYNENNLLLDFDYNKEELFYLKKNKSLAFYINVEGIDEARLCYQK